MIVIVGAVALLGVGMLVLRTRSSGEARPAPLLALLPLLAGLSMGLLIAGAVWLFMDAQRRIVRTNLVRAIEQMDELARADDHAALGPALAACRVELAGGGDSINALGRLNTALFRRRQEINLVDKNGLKLP